MPVVPTGATFSFHNIVASVTEISVDSPSAEIVDMTGVGNPTNSQVLVPTGAKTGGIVRVSFASSLDPQGLVGRRGTLTFSATGFSVSRNVILESGTVDVRTGDIVRGTLTFRMTDYYGN